MLLEAGVAGPGVEALEQPPRRRLLVQELDRFARQRHELPAAPARSAGHDGRGSSRVADLDVQRVEHPRLVEDDVDDEPVVEERPVLHRDPGQRPNGAVGAVAADDVPGPDRTGGAAHDHVVALVGEVRHRPAPPDLDPGELVDPGEQHRFELGLGEHGRLGPARRAVAPPAEANQGLPLGVLELVDLGRLDDPGALLRHAAGLQDAGHLVVVVHGAGQRVWLRVTLEHRHPVALLAEQDRQGGTDRAVPDDRDVEELAVVHVFLRACHTRRGARSPFSYCVRSAFLSNLPTDVFGITSTNAQFSGTCHLAT